MYSGIKVQSIKSIEAFSPGDSDGPDWIAIGTFYTNFSRLEWFVVRG